MRTLGKILAGICAALFVVTGVISLLLFNVERKAFSAATYKQAFERQALYERMPTVLAGALTSSVAENPNAAPYLKVITQADWERIIASLLPPEELKALTNAVLDSTFDYLNGKSDSISISLLPLKNRFSGPAGMEAIKKILSTQPDCTAEQLLQMGLGFLTGEEIVLCNPPAKMLDLALPMLESQLQAVTAGFPDEVILVDATQNNTPNDLRGTLGRVRTIMKFSPLIPLLFLIGLTIFAVRRLVGWLRWWGIPFLVTGGTGALIALIGSPVLSLLIQRTIQNQRLDSLPPVLLTTAQEAVGEVARQILRPVIIEGVILTALGMGMLILAFFLSKREKVGTPAK
ncbi:MAG: hypothetical protein HXY35_02180 [Chloroflexi bacterium]|nr:hypothetical protein [Chloroflexota bacterium]